VAANDKQVGGEHYKTEGLQHWDLAASRQYDYFQGQITKYVDRWKKKNGLDDLLKAQHFLEKYIECVRAGYFVPDNQLGPKRAAEPTIKLITDLIGDFIVVSMGLNDGSYVYECVHCGTRVVAKSIVDASEQHGECATPAYVNQG
jgi:Protein of unknwon function (DUF3310)